MSVDALRGFDMFWIIGADALVRGLRSMGDTGFTGTLATQLEHVDWEGFRFYDLIFPLFIFIVGVFWDPEGCLSAIPAVVTCLLGVFAGLLLRNPAVSERRKVTLLLSLGVTAVALGWLWSLQFPVIKKIWTSSYVLVAGGYSAILLGLFYLIVDVWKRRSWCQPFVWIGMNSITIYLTKNIIGDFRTLARRLVGGDLKVFFDDQVTKGFGDMMISIVGLLLAFWFVHFLYKRKIFLRL